MNKQIYIIILFILFYSCSYNSFECGFNGTFDESEYVEVKDTDSLFIQIFNKAASIANVRDKNIEFKKFRGRSKNSHLRPMAIAKIRPEKPKRGIREQIRVRFSEDYFNKYYNQSSANKFLQFDSGEDIFFNWSPNDEGFFNLLFVIFHELGHFLSSDNLKKRDCNSNKDVLVDSELQADYFAAEQLYKLKITPIYNIYKVFNDFKNKSENSSCYPTIKERIEMTKKGFNDARKRQATEVNFGVREILNSSYLESSSNKEGGLSDGTLMLAPDFNELNSGAHIIYEYVGYEGDDLMLDEENESRLYGIKHKKIIILQDALNGINIYDNLKTEVLPFKYEEHHPIGLSSRNKNIGINQIYGINKTVLTDTIEVVFKKVRFDSLTRKVLEDIIQLNLDEEIKDKLRPLTGDFVITEHFTVGGMHIRDFNQDTYADLYLDEFGSFKTSDRPKMDKYLRPFGQGKYEVIQEGFIIVKRVYEKYDLVFDSQLLDNDYIDYGFTIPRDLNCFKYFKNLYDNDTHSIMENESGNLIIEKRNLNYQGVVLEDDGTIRELGDRNSGVFILPFTTFIDPCMKF